MTSSSRGRYSPFAEVSFREPFVPSDQFACCMQSIRLRYHPHTMWPSITSRFLRKKLDELPAVLAAATNEALAAVTPEEESKLLMTVGWLSAAMGAVAIGLFVGRELRQRYKFNRRTPYDFYAHSGDEMTEMEFGVGI